MRYTDTHKKCIPKAKMATTKSFSRNCSPHRFKRVSVQQSIKPPEHSQGRAATHQAPRTGLWLIAAIMWRQAKGGEQSLVYSCIHLFGPSPQQGPDELSILSERWSACHSSQTDSCLTRPLPIPCCCRTAHINTENTSFRLMNTARIHQCAAGASSS